MISVSVHGAGRMAKAVVEAAAGQEDLTITSIVSRGSARWAGSIPCFNSLAHLPATPDVLIDFTLPDGTAAAAPWCAAQGVALVSGVTGLGEGAFEALRKAASQVPVLWGANLSIGVNLLAELARKAATVVGDASSVLIEETHHQWKKDAPSGTALMLGSVIDAAQGVHGNEITYASTREGEVIGEHRVTFRLAGEDITLAHEAHDRSIYARGALTAAQWLVKQEPGIYTTTDWLAG